MLDAVASLVYVLFDISGDRNKFVLGAPSFDWQGPDNEIYGQLFFLQVLITKKKVCITVEAKGCGAAHTKSNKHYLIAHSLPS